MEAKFLQMVVSISFVSILVSGCNQENSTIAQLEAIEQRAARGEQGQATLSFRLKELPPGDALVLSDKLKQRGARHEIVNLLRFAHLYKLGKEELALAALEIGNEEFASLLATAIREQRRLSDELQDIDVVEGLELRQQLEGLSDCEIQVATGEFKPLTGSEFCMAWDSGIIDLLPTPGKVATTIGRQLARRSLRQLPRDKIRKLPRAAAVMTKHDKLRDYIQKKLTAQEEFKEKLIEQLLDFQWNVVVSLSAPK